MTISDSLPIQFWDVDEETFNEKVICGLSRQECFCQPVECSDIMPIQFQDDVWPAYQLSFYDENGDLLQSIDFIEIQDGVWALDSANETSPAVCQRVQLKIEVDFDQLVNGDFTGSLSPWTNEGSGDEIWSYVNNQATINFQLTGPAENSSYLTQTFVTYVGLIYQINVNAILSDTGGFAYSGELRVYFSNGTLRDIVFSSNFDEGSIGQIGGQINFTALNNYDRVEIYVLFTSSDNGADVTIDVDSISISATNNVLKKSDCIDLKDSHPCTTLIEYSNSSNFDGIVYETSPQPSFFLRIPAMFHEEDNPMTQEDLELSNGVIVTLRQSLQEKRLLETGYMPNYMHRKLQKVLMHEEITIDGTQWKRRDSYDADPIKKYNLKRAEVMLTKYNSVEKNTI